MAFTPKKKAFARCVGSGMSLSDSYREAYNAKNMSAACIRVEASKLMSDPNVTLMVERIQKAAERAVVASTVSDRERVLTKLREIIDNAEGTPAEQVILRACDLLGKSAGLYKDVVETVVQRSPQEIRDEIDKRLDAIEARQDTDKDKPEASVH